MSEGTSTKHSPAEAMRFISLFKKLGFSIDGKYDSVTKLDSEKMGMYIQGNDSVVKNRSVVMILSSTLLNMIFYQMRTTLLNLIFFLKCDSFCHHRLH